MEQGSSSLIRKSCLLSAIALRAGPPAIVCGRSPVIYYVIKYGRWRFVAVATLIIYRRESWEATSLNCATRGRRCDDDDAAIRLTYARATLSPPTYLLTHLRSAGLAGRQCNYDTTSCKFLDDLTDDLEGHSAAAHAPVVAAERTRVLTTRVHRDSSA